MDSTTKLSDMELANPSQPEERAELDLPPKSYADAFKVGTEGEMNSRTAQVAESFQLNDTTRPYKPQANGVPDDTLVYGKHRSRSGEMLTSVKPDVGHDEALDHNERVAPRKRRNTAGASELASGRRAGAGWEKSAIRWAPLNVPLQRRLQMLMVLYHTLTIPIMVTTFFIICAIPLSWPLLVPYLLHLLLFSKAATSGSLSRRSEWLRGSKIWSLYASYFPARLHRTVELPPTRKYIFGYHPHGIISHGAFAAFATEALGFKELYPGITNTLLTLDANFRLPFYRDYVLAMGLASVSKESIENILSKGGADGEGMGRAVTIVIGGARESLDAQPKTLRLVLKSRKGFIKIAIRTGADLVPVLAFGENELYDQAQANEHPYIHKFQMLVKKVFGFTVPLFHARGIFNYDVGLMPYRRSLNVVVGRPIQVVQQGSDGGKVDEAYIDRLHAEYVKELERLWEAHRDVFAKEITSGLEIVE